MDNEANLVPLPDDSQALKAMLCTLIDERNQEKQRANDLQVKNLRLQLETMKKCGVAVLERGSFEA